MGLGREVWARRWSWNLKGEWKTEGRVLASGRGGIKTTNQVREGDDLKWRRWAWMLVKQRYSIIFCLVREHFGFGGWIVICESFWFSGIPFKSL